MQYCVYIYTPKLSDASVRSLVAGLPESGVSITHLGKTDPPNRWSGDVDLAVSQILGGSDLTNWTFLRDSESRLDFSIEMHRDPRWEHDTISLSGAPEDRVTQIAESLVERIQYYLVIIGVLGGGKTQTWRVIRISCDCPTTLRKRFACS